MDVHLMMIDAPYYEPAESGPGETDSLKPGEEKPPPKTDDEAAKRLQMYMDKFNT